MKILVTGATGLVGKELVKHLRAKNHTVNYLTTSLSKIKNKSNYRGFYWNPELGKIDENCLYEVDIIVHLAGANISKRWTNAYKQEIIESRTLSAELLYNLVRKTPNKVRQFISASAIAIYPESHNEVYDETVKETDNSFLSTVVQKWEESANRFQVLGVKVCKIRTGLVLSNEGGALPEMAKPIKMGFGAVFGNGKQVQSWIHIEDLVDMYVFAIEKQLEGTYNAVAPNPVTNKQLTKAIAQKLHKSLWLPNIPRFVMKLILGEMSTLLFSSNNLSSGKIQDLGFQFQFPEIKEAMRNLYP
ncbi:MAG: TIGR01777 family oxidoreductase [Flavobacterium sp.]